MDVDLRLVRLSDIELQEKPDKSRLQTLIEKMKASGVLKDPPIVTEGIGKKLMQLDGTTRISTLREMGCSHAVVQFVDYSDTSQVLIKSWVHVSKVKKGVFIRKLKSIKGVKAENFKIGMGVTLTGHPLALVTVIFRDGTGFSLHANSNLFIRVRLIHQVVRFYEELIFRDREVAIESMAELSEFFAGHKDKNVALLFPSFSFQEVYSLLKRKMVLPQGVTRHIINGRVLRIDYPISMLKKEVGEEKKKKFFRKYIKDLNLRLYEESTLVVEQPS